MIEFYPTAIPRDHKVSIALVELALPYHLRVLAVPPAVQKELQIFAGAEVNENSIHTAQTILVR